ncbi:MAG: efflux RND transporter periplasmic adaptor subunit [Candidatus Binataceae bacterium]|jgi:multidrug efflux system membrane fusion protein
MPDDWSQLARTAAVLALMSVFSAVLLAGCTHGDDTGANQARPPVPVLAAKAEQRTVPNQLEAIGSVEALATVGIKAQVGAELVAIHFKEGDYVTRGQLLFTLDRRPFQAALNAAEADLARDTATAHKAILDEQRYSFLLRQGVGSREQYDQSYATSASSSATVAADRAAVESARLNLEFTEITAPVDGRTGSLQSHLGEIIKADADNPIVTITQVEPLYVTFSIPEHDLPAVRRNMEMRRLSVEAVLPGDQMAGDQDETETGVLAFVDNMVDKTTGTITLKGLFPNHDRRLWPGQFVNVKLTLDEIPNAILIPSQAIQTGQDGPFVFIVSSDMKALPRPIVPGVVIGSDTVIERGIEAGTTVVTDGQLRLMPGAPVRIKPSLESGNPS